LTRRDDLVLHVDLPTTPGPPRGGAGASVHDALEAAMPGLDHVAILVKDLDAAIALYRDVYGLTLDEVEDVPTEKVRVAIFGHGAGRIELVCPTDPGSALAKRIAEKGEGLHHICLAVPDIAEAMDALRARGAPLLDERPRPGAGGSQVAFVHPKGSRGVLVELKQG
jgi:methylmalonyl-CoA/ethylmalonyl-CoA epimerase